MKKNTIRARQITQDCWDLKDAFMKWLKERLPVYYRDAGSFIDLDFHKIEYKGITYTQRELLNKLMFLVDNYREHSENEYDDANEICDMWKALMNYMWW